MVYQLTKSQRKWVMEFAGKFDYQVCLSCVEHLASSIFEEGRQAGLEEAAGYVDYGVSDPYITRKSISKAIRALKEPT